MLCSLFYLSCWFYETQKCRLIFWNKWIGLYHYGLIFKNRKNCCSLLHWIFYWHCGRCCSRSGNEEKLMALLTPLNVNCHASDGRKVKKTQMLKLQLTCHLFTVQHKNACLFVLSKPLLVASTRMQPVTELEYRNWNCLLVHQIIVSCQSPVVNMSPFSGLKNTTRPQL